MSDLSDLIARLEQASGADRKLDQSFAVWSRNFNRTDGRTIIGVANCAEFTGSLDAAVAFAARVLPGEYVAMVLALAVSKAPRAGFVDALPRYVCIEILRALAAKGEKSDG